MASSIDRPAPTTNWQSIDIESLESLVGDKAGRKSLVELQDQDAARVVDLLDQALDLPNLEERLEKRYIYTLSKLCCACGTLPTSYKLLGDIEVIGIRPRTSGGFADVWMGRYKHQDVALKVLRTCENDDLIKVNQQFCREILVWRRLSHPNVLPFLGVVTLPQFSFCMASRWMTHGNVVNYVKSHPEANRLRLLSDVASGLDYLHEKDIVHGDLKGANILVNDKCHAVLADFGLIAVIPTNSFRLTMTTVGAGTVRWMAPELLNPEAYNFTHCKPSKESDMYALGMVIYEAITGDIPFKKEPDVTVTIKVLDGCRPERPIDAVAMCFLDVVWQIAQDCWQQQYAKRPEIRLVLDRLNQITQCWVSPPPVAVDSQVDDPDGEDESITFSDMDPTPHCTTSAVAQLQPVSTLTLTTRYNWIPRTYIDIISQASSKWPILDPRMNLQAGDFGKVGRDTGEFERRGNIYQNLDILRLLPDLAKHSHQPVVSQPMDQWIIKSDNTKQRDFNSGPFIDGVNVAEASLMVELNIKRGSVGAFIAMHRPRSTDLPKNVVLKQLFSLKPLNGMSLVTGVISCSAYALCLTDNDTENVRVAFVGSLPTVAPGLGGKNRGWLWENKPAYHQEAFDHTGNSTYSPLCTLKRGQDNFSWFR